MPPGFSTRPKCNPINLGKLQDPNSPSLTWVLPIMNWLNSFQAFHEPPNTTRVPRSPGPPLLAAPFTGFRFGPGKTGHGKMAGVFSEFNGARGSENCYWYYSYHQRMGNSRFTYIGLILLGMCRADIYSIHGSYWLLGWWGCSQVLNSEAMVIPTINGWQA